MTKKSEIPHTRRKVPDFGKQEETLEETKIRNSEYYDMQLALLYHLMNNPCGKQSVEYNDNRIALYVHRKENVLFPVWNWKQIKWTVTTKSHWCLGAMTVIKT